MFNLSKIRRKCLLQKLTAQTLRKICKRKICKMAMEKEVSLMCIFLNEINRIVNELFNLD